MPTEDAYSSGHLVLSQLGFANVLLLRPLTLNHTIHPFMTLYPDLTFTEFDITEYRFPGAFATGVACRQGTLTPPDTRSCPTLGLACVLMSRPISPELVLSPDLWISNTPRYFSFALQPSDLSSLPDGRTVACPIRMSLYICVFLIYDIYYLCCTCIDEH